MKPFMNEDFLLTSPTAQKLYHKLAAKLPIVDYHCHIDPKEIYEDKRFRNLYEIWLSGDHYKWRLMRSNGIDEAYITGNAPEKEKFLKFAEMLPKAIGNPMYHWCHLELKKYFGYNGILNADTAEEVWALAEEKLKDPSMSARGIIRQSNVMFIGTTDDPIDSLEYHKKLKEDGFETIVAPTFRPDKAFQLEKAGWQTYIEKLSDVAEIHIDSFEALKQALSKRIHYFGECGCRASDHGLDYMVFQTAPTADLEKIMQKALKGKPTTEKERAAFKTHLLMHCAEEYSHRGWVMQLHYNCLRNPNTKMFSLLGPDKGFDCIGPHESSSTLPGLLDILDGKGLLPKTVIYSLDATDNAFIDTLIGAFQGTEIPGKLQHGSAWWFNDHKAGMEEQLTSLANLSLLGNFIGMLTDSRSFLSYTRHEYFRRILCNLIGGWVESGQYPNDKKALAEIVAGICFYNAKRYFNL